MTIEEKEPDNAVQNQNEDESETDDDKPRVLTFPGDLEITIMPHKREQPAAQPPVYITMERNELESLVGSIAEARAEKLFEARAATLVKTLIQQERHDNSSDKDEKEGFLGAAETAKGWELDEAEQEEEIEWHTPFGETVYTLMYMCPSRRSFLYSFFVYAIQTLTVSLTISDVVGKGSPDNRLSLPPMVDLPVTFAQGLTCFVVLAYMSDLIEAVIKIQDGFYPVVMEKHPGATYNTWLLSCMAQLMAGLLVLTASFILTMQASTVLDLMLNLTALLFMAEIDDIGFSLAKNGFVSDKLQIECESVLDFEVPKPKRRNIQRRILYFLALVGLLTGYGILKKRQLDGRYLPTNVYCQFGDSYNPVIPFYSGILSSGKVRTSNYREYRDLGTQNILLAYCYKEKSWTISDTNDPCDYIATSSNTKDYDVTKIPSSFWQIKDPIDRLMPFDQFAITARDCKVGTCQGTCNEEGLCDCTHDRFGMDCEFFDVCSDLQIDSRFGGFGSIQVEDESFSISERFHVLKNPATNEHVRVYNMPVYYSNSTFPANIIFYGGRRWILTSEWDLFNMTLSEMHSSSKYFLEETVETLETRFHGYYQANYTPFFISDPVDFATPNFQSTPIGLGWWTVKQMGMNNKRSFVPDILQNTKLTCTVDVPSCIGQPDDFCNPKAGECNQETGLCDCFHLDYTGAQCELLKPCYDQGEMQCGGNGNCDVSTGLCRCNKPYFGPLCERTFKCYEEGGVCRNGGTCNLVTGHCECGEDPAIFGVACEKRKDCYSFGCANGGYCSDANGACICRPPFYGAACDLVDTSMTEYLCKDDSDCFDGTCNLESGICSCTNPGSYGTLCEHQYNCTELLYINDGTTCHNGGTCNNSTGLCDCDEELGFFGYDCSQYTPCRNDTDCVQDPYWPPKCDTASGECICPFGISQGPKCQNVYWCADDDYCTNGSCNIASYSCQCVPGVGGFKCDSFLPGFYEAWRDDLFAELEQAVIDCNYENVFDCIDV